MIKLKKDIQKTDQAAKNCISTVGKVGKKKKRKEKREVCLLMRSLERESVVPRERLNHSAEKMTLITVPLLV